MSIYWKPEYSVGVREIDNQHKEFLKIIRRLYESVPKNTAKEEIEDILNSLTDYAQKHFATEESYFKKFKYENIREHEKSHKAFADKMKDLMKDLENDKLKVSFDTADFLEDWLLDHIMDQDQQYVKCFKENGLK